MKTTKIVDRDSKYYTKQISYIKISKPMEIQTIVDRASNNNVIINPDKISKAKIKYNPCIPGNRLNTERDSYLMLKKERTTRINNHNSRNKAT